MVTQNTPFYMFEGVLNTPVFRLHLVIFCIITGIWWDVLNSFMARGWSALLWVFQKNCIDNISFRSWKRDRLMAFIFGNMIQYPCTVKNNIYHLNKWRPPPFFHSDTIAALGHNLVHSADKTHVLVVTVELIYLLFLNIYLNFCFVPTLNKSLRFTM